MWNWSVRLKGFLVTWAGPFGDYRDRGIAKTDCQHARRSAGSISLLGTPTEGRCDTWLIQRYQCWISTIAGGLTTRPHMSAEVSHCHHSLPDHEWTLSRADVQLGTCTCAHLCPGHRHIKLQFSGLALNMEELAIHMCKNVSQLMELKPEAECFRTCAGDRHSRSITDISLLRLA